MRSLSARTVLGVAFFSLALLGCGDDNRPRPAPEPAAPVDPLAGLEPWGDPWIDAHGPSYLEDAGARRRGLEGALTNPENLYSKVRLSSFGLPRGGWSSLPEWRPRTLPIDAARASAIARGELPEVPETTEPFARGVTPSTHAEWVALGERVFFELPLRAEPVWETALRDPALAAALGVESRADGSVVGLVLVRDIDGSSQVGITCALCHAARVGDDIVAGRARRTLDYGAARIEAARARGITIAPESIARYESWGPGRADVLEELAEVPIAIPDLWALRELRWLTQAGTLRHESPVGLAVRQETQYIQANHLHTRPPRELVWALVVYLYSLEPPDARAADAPHETILRGATTFARTCGECHGGLAGSGSLVDAALVGTDPELATGEARGTGRYRPAPLVRVGDAAPYLHHGVVPSLEDLLSSTRTEPGHRYGMDLDVDDRAALLAYLRTR